ncbi:MAG: Phosphatidyl-myo-inositol mannosyltransferase [Dehalococcoidia bacterium]|nr:Phosphatidyl-myo-inositol mannosyltransferase [Bacillota bacterium]
MIYLKNHQNCLRSYSILPGREWCFLFLPHASPKEVKKRLRIALVGSHLPRKCGIATFATSLSGALEGIIGRDSTLFVALNNNERYDYPSKVIYQIKQDCLEDYQNAADLINSSAVDIVSLQHEFGLFGGPEGIHIVEFLSYLQKPVVTTFHTVLEKPSASQKKALIGVAAFSQALVVMNERAIAILTDIYNIPHAKIHLIQHGVPDTFYIDPSYYKHQLQLAGHFVILTFGFLNPNKGIEIMLKAMPPVVEKHPEVLYIVLGVTHPTVKKHHGEEYREGLENLVKILNITENVLFVDEFVDDDTLGYYLGAADLVVCPYHSEGQITSGVLSNSLGKGKAIISTPFLHAREALAGEKGRVVNFNDPVGMTEAVMQLIENPEERLSLAGQAYIAGQRMGWSRISKQYLDVFEDLASQVIGTTKQDRVHTLPVINMNYLKTLTDDTSIVQHALFGIPDYAHNYSADDAGRAIVVCAHYFNMFRDESVLSLIDRYLAFLSHARQESGWFYNYLNYQKGFPAQELSQDTFGRCLWGLGAAASLVQNRDQSMLARELLYASLPQLDKLVYTRAQAYSACGLGNYLFHYPESKPAKDGLRLIVDSLLQRYRENASGSWRWFENFLTYDNARLPHALLLGYRHFSEPAYLETALSALDFLIDIQYQEGYFDLIGNHGWYVKGGEKAVFCQQPLDAGALTEVCLLASALSGQQKYLDLAYAAFQWYLGRNRLGKALYNPSTGSCSDGLAENGPSKNKGAESTISFLLGLLALYSWELFERFHYEKEITS